MNWGEAFISVLAGLTGPVACSIYAAAAMVAGFAFAIVISEDEGGVWHWLILAAFFFLIALPTWISASSHESFAWVLL